LAFLHQVSIALPGNLSEMAVSLTAGNANNTMMQTKNINASFGKVSHSLASHTKAFHQKREYVLL